MEQIKRFVDCAVPVMTCNLRCPYCYITQERKFLNDLPNFKYSPEIVEKAFDPQRWGGIIHINLCGGGETLLPPEMPKYIYAMLKQGHYVAVVTNGTVTKSFKEICDFPKEFLERLLFKFSFHYLELKRLKMLEKFFDNIKMVKEAGCSYSLELTPSDDYLPYIEEIKSVCLEKMGALCHVTVARKETDPELPILTKLKKEEYCNIWGQFKSELFSFKMETFNVKRKEFCYAGEWTSYLNIGTGVLKQCYCGAVLQNIFNDPEEPIKWKPIGANCPEPHCHNAHVWLTLGAIPSLNTPTYAAMRDRKLSDDTHWLNPRMQSFLSGKLCDNNYVYTSEEEKKINRKEKWHIFFTYGMRSAAKSAFYLLPKSVQVFTLKKIRHNK